MHNIKQVDQANPGCNRTIMELKPLWDIGSHIYHQSCNRTIMELKPGMYCSRNTKIPGCNRTIMELKH